MRRQSTEFAYTPCATNDNDTQDSSGSQLMLAVVSEYCNMCMIELCANKCCWIHKVDKVAGHREKADNGRR